MLKPVITVQGIMTLIMLINTTDDIFGSAVLILLVICRSFCINKSFAVSKNMTNCYACQPLSRRIYRCRSVGPLPVLIRSDALRRFRWRVWRKKNVITFFQVMTSFLTKAQARHYQLRSNDNNNAAENDRREIGACLIDIVKFDSVVSHKQSFRFSEDTNGHPTCQLFDK